MIEQLKANQVLDKTKSEGILALAALNKLEKRKEVYKRFRICNLNISFHARSSKNLWGRFGGGWQWALGFEASKSTLLLNCLVFTIMIWREKKK